MDNKKLARANSLKEELNQLNEFIFVTERAFKGKLTIKGKIMRFISGSCRYFETIEFRMNDTIRNRVLDVLIEYKEELEKEFERL